jgi:hypothetical protein
VILLDRRTNPISSRPATPPTASTSVHADVIATDRFRLLSVAR